jgi:hypothetical protein
MDEGMDEKKKPAHFVLAANGVEVRKRNDQCQTNM